MKSVPVRTAGRKPKPDNERFRRCRLGELRRLFRDRWGPTLPDDDAGRGDLRELLLLASMAFNPERKMRNVLSQAAPWITAEEAEQAIDDVNRTPTYLRKPSARTLGDRLRLTSEERHRLAICTIRPFDRTDAELEVQRKRKDAERKWRKRRAAKAKPREAWLANCKTKTKPWEKRGMSRRTWYRKQAKQRTKVAQVGGTGPSAVKLTYCTGQTCAKSESEGGRGLALGAAAPSGGRGLPRKGQGRSPTAKAFGPCIGEGQHEAKKAS